MLEKLGEGWATKEDVKTIEQMLAVVRRIWRSVGCSDSQRQSIDELLLITGAADGCHDLFYKISVFSQSYPDQSRPYPKLFRTGLCRTLPPTGCRLTGFFILFINFVQSELRCILSPSHP